MERAELLKRKKEIETELEEISKKLAELEIKEKPFEAVVHGYSSPGISSTFWKTEEQARRKYEEYRGKKYFRNGRIDGVILYRHNSDGTRTVLEYEAKVPWWKLPAE